MSDVRQRVSDLSPEQRQLLERLLDQEEALARSVVPRISRRSAAEALPLSFAQQRLWFLDQWEPGSPAYNLPQAIRLTGRLDVPTLVRTLRMIVQRHESLRATFATIEEQPVQVIAPAMPLLVPVLDLEELAEPTRDATVGRLSAAESRHAFDLARGPLLRATLLRLAPREHLLLLNMHHIISDRWSMGVLVREVLALYPAFVAGRPSPLADLPIQYADFALWQQQWLQGARLEEQLAYWRRQLAGAPPLLTLPTDRPRPPAQRYHGASQSLMLPAPLAQALTALSQRTGATLFMSLLSAFALLLGRYASQDDVSVGTFIANRTRDELEGLIGFFVNTLVLRSDLSGNPPFREVLRRAREAALGAYAHQEVPFEKLLEELHPARALSHTPLFQVMLVLQNTPRPRLELPDLTIEVLAKAPSSRSNFDLTLWAQEHADGLLCEWEYSTDLFDAGTIARMQRHFLAVIVQAAANPDLRLHDIALVSTAEQQELLRPWPATSTPVVATVHEIFEAQAERTPDAIAVTFAGSTANDQRPTTNDQQTTTDDIQDKETRRQGDKEIQARRTDEDSAFSHPEGTRRSAFSVQLTYQELNARANRLAQHLRALGVGPEARVAICMERSPDLIVGVLAILKAGAAYVPLDPAYPAERLAFMLADSGARVLVTRGGEAGGWRLEAGSESPVSSLQSPVFSTVVDLRADWPVIARQPPITPDSGVTLDHLAYVIYTSGSTGRPKGVMVRHGSLVRAAHAWEQTYGLREAPNCLLQIASSAFDVFTGDLIRALCFGGTLVLCPRDALMEPGELYALLERERVTCAEFVPALARLLSDYLRRTGRALRHMRTLIAGADRWPAQERARLQQVCSPATRLINSYGVTEATIDNICFDGAVPDALADELVPIGRPFAHTQIYVLDAYLQPVPAGVVGELYIGGAGLARGYLGRPELTAERFIPNPFAKVSGVGYRVSEEAAPDTWHLTPATCLYKTGDLARYLPDGTIVFLGRDDQQVKLRGFRIELGEIGAALAEHPAVQSSVVLVREDTPGEQRLVAYVVPTTDDRRPTTDDRLTDKETRRQGDRQDSQLLVSLSPGLMSQELSFISDLRTYLKQTLPEYMVPSAFVLLSALPLTANGKLNHRALRAPERELQTARGFVAPRTPVEEVLASIMADVLGLPQVGADDNFFALGGHSLLATQVVTRICEVFQVVLPLRSLFEAPSVTGMAERVEVARQAAAEIPAPPLEPTPRDGDLPLSFAQQRLWFLDQLEPGSPFYNIPAAVRLAGRFDVMALRRSLAVIVRRHESLRTSFTAVGGRPRQAIAATVAIALPVVDLGAIPDPMRDAEALRLADAEAQRPFDLMCELLLRATLLRLDAVEHVLLLTMHHIISDGWSIGIMVHELAALYSAFRGGPAAPLPELPVQYTDFARWQRRWLQGAVLETQLAYWREHLRDAPMLQLPIDRPRPAIQRFKGARQSFVVAPALTAALNGLSRRAGVTLFMTLLAAFQALLARYSAQDDIVVGSPIANRTRRAIEGLIGFFANTLVLRSDLSGNPVFLELLRRVREVLLDAYAHQDLPFEKLVDELHPERSLGHNPLFQVMFVLQNTPMPRLELPSLTLTTLAIENSTAKFDLWLSMVEDGELLRATFEYNTDIFDHTSIVRLSAHFQALLGAIAAHPELRYAGLPLLTTPERQQLLIEWNDTIRGVRDQGSGASRIDPDSALLASDSGLLVSDAACLHRLIELQAARTPDAVAVVFETTDDRRPMTNDQRQPTTTPSLQPPASSLQHLTYRELNRRANQLARHLRGLGVGPDRLVAICADRSLELVIGLLGILKAGGAYVPLDPGYPPDRLAFMLEDADVSVLITATDDSPDKETRRLMISRSPCLPLSLSRARWSIYAQIGGSSRSSTRPTRTAV